MMKDPCPKGALMHPTDADNNKEHLLQPPSSNNCSNPPPSSPRATAATPPRYNRRRRRSITFAENKTVAVFDPKSKACNAFELPQTEVFAPPPRTMSSDTMSLENETSVVVEAEIDDDDDDVPKPFVEEPTSEDASNTRSEETPEEEASPLVLSQQEQRPSKDRPLVRLTVNLLATYQNIAVKEGCDDVVFTAKPMMADPTKMWRRLDQTLEDVSGGGKGGKKKKKKQLSPSEERKTKDYKKEQPETTTTTPQKPETDSGRDDSVETTAEITSVTTLSSSSEEVAVVMEVSEKDIAPKGDSPPTNDKPTTPKQPVQGKLEHQKSPTSVTYLGQVDETTSDPPQSASAAATNVPTEVEVETLEPSTSTGSTAVESGHHKSSSSKKSHHHHHHKSSSRGNSSGKKNKPPKSPSAYFPKKKVEAKKQKSLTLDDVIKPSRKSPRKGRSTRSLTAESVVSGRSSSVSSRKKSKSKKSLSRKRSSSLDAASRLTPDDIAKDLKQHRSKPLSSSKNKNKDEETKELTIQDLEKPVLKKSLSSRKKSKDNHHQSCSSLPTPKNSLSASESPAPPAETTTTGTPKRKPSRRRRASLQAGIPEPPLFIEFEEQQPSETDSKQDAPPPAAPSSPSPKGPPTSELDSLKDLYAQHYRSILNSPSRRQSQEEGRSPGTSGRTSSPHRRLDTSLGLVEKVLRDAAFAMGHPESPTRTIPAEETAATAAAERTPSPTRRRISQPPRHHEGYVPPSPLVPPEQEQNQKETSQRSRTISIGQHNHHQHVKKVRRKSATGVVTKTTKTKHTKQLTVVVIICSRFPNKAVKSRQETALTALREAGIQFDILDDGADPANDAILDELFDISGFSRGEEAYPQFFCMDESTPGPFMFKGNWNWFQKVLREGGGSLKRALFFSSRRASCRV